MGFNLMVNFNRPYLALSIADFWRRWHLSLSTWFRDYVYIPLGGNRVPRARVCFNLAIVFVVSGVWHGANWTFVVWGALHAVYIVVHVLTHPLRMRLESGLSRAGKWLWDGGSWLLTLSLVTLAWVFFRAATMSDALLILRRILTWYPGTGSTTLHPGLDSLQFGIALSVIAALFVLEVVATRKPIWPTLALQPRWMRWSAYYGFGLAFAILLLLSPLHTAQPFVYFQF
jgi:D-alanyl-lipoteichoic acid acyltransferase DltB (MBOAT superfamily)